MTTMSSAMRLSGGLAPNAFTPCMRIPGYVVGFTH